MIKIDGRGMEHQTLEHLRQLAVRRVVEGGEAPSEVMRSLGLCRTSIYPWLRKYRRQGAEALKGTKAKGPQSKLKVSQRITVRTWIVGKDPRQYGFEFGLWTRQIVATLIKEKFGIQMGLTAVGRLLASLQITPQKPLRRAYERDPQAVEEWIKRRYPRLRQRARRHQAKIYFLDEAGFSSEPALGRTYGLKGHTPVVQTTGQRQKINAISALNARGGFWCQTYTGTLNAACFVQFLKAFRKSQRGKIYLVLDAHPSHKAKIVSQYVQSTQGKLELHFLPPYAPDLNPDEFVWQYAKTNGAAKRPLRKNQSLKERVAQDLKAIGKNKKLLRSFFNAPCVVYAKD